MGCDIHMVVERRVDGKWEAISELPPRPCSWCSGAGHYENRPKDKCYSCKGSGTQTGAYRDRNYTVFSVLADVRNDGYVTPISKPRGLPTEHERDNEDESSCFGDHSFSWLTLTELQAHDWKQPRQDEGWVSVEEFKRWEAAGKGCPRGWSGDVGGGCVEKVSNKDMRRHIADPYPWEAGKSFYTLVQWTTTLADRCRAFLAFVETLSALGAPEDVRIVFGFDS